MRADRPASPPDRPQLCPPIYHNPPPLRLPTTVYHPAPPANPPPSRQSSVRPCGHIRHRFRLAPESMACGQMHRHSGASRNLWRMVRCTVIPAQAGIYGGWSHSPSFRRKPESMADGHIHRHSGESRNLRATMGFGFRRRGGRPAQPPRPCGHIHRHSGESRNLGRMVTFTVIPAQAGIYALRWTPVFAGATEPHLKPPERKHYPKPAKQR